MNMEVLWKSELHKEKEEWAIDFMSKGDKELDLSLLLFDILCTKAHAHVLHEMKILSREELSKIKETLEELKKEYKEGKITRIDAEDVHSFVEIYLTKKLGDIGKKIHMFRSRNDLISMDMRLYIGSAIDEIAKKAEEVVKVAIDKAQELNDIVVPGFTHMQPAMPFTAGGYIHCFAESLQEDIELGKKLKKLLVKNVLGSGAGFGFPVKIPRKVYLKHLPVFGEIKNPLYAVISRPKVEKEYLFWIYMIADSIEKFCSTLIFLAHEKIFELPEFAVTGSSIMPQKKNPDMCEVIRGRVKKIKGYFEVVKQIDENLGIGYFRDFQESKEIVMKATEEIQEILEALTKLIAGLKAKEKIIEETYYTYEAIELAMQGTPWREAYKKIAEKVKKGEKPKTKYKKPITKI